MPTLRSSRFCLPICLWTVCIAAGLSAPPAQVPKPEAAAFSRAIQQEDVTGVAKDLKADPNLANPPLIFGGSGTASETHLPLSLTAFEGNTQIAALLIRAGAKVNAADQDGQTALDEAAYFSHETMAAFLLAHDADIAHKNKTGQTALHQAVAGNDPATVALLLNHGADATARDSQGATPLGLALGLHCRASVVALLRKHGAKE